MSLHISARANLNRARQQTLTVCHAETEWDKNGTHSTFSRKKWNGVPVLAAKNSTLLPKMELLFILANRQKRTPHGIRCQFGCQIYINFSVKTGIFSYFLHWQLKFEAKDIFTIIFSDFCTTAKPSSYLQLSLTSSRCSSVR